MSDLSEKKAVLTPEQEQRRKELEPYRHALDITQRRVFDLKKKLNAEPNSFALKEQLDSANQSYRLAQMKMIQALNSE